MIPKFKINNIPLGGNLNRPNKYFKILALLFAVIKLNAATETISSGSFIINMGVTPQTFENGLKPYGLVYDLLKNHKVPIKWIINPSKGKDGIDFSYNGIDYKGGTFIIQSEYRSAAVNARIVFWQSLGVVGVTTNSSINVPVALTLTAPPNWTLDQQNGKIAEDYIINAGIPVSAYSFKDPALLDCCDDVFAMPHADPDWSTHSRLYSWNKDCLGTIWAACHAVSALENLYNPADTVTQMNFLSNKVPKNPKPSPYAENSLLIWTDHANGTPPYNYYYHTDPIMQFMGNLDDATDNGSENIYMPVLSGSWRASTKLAVIDLTQSDIPTKSPGPATVVAYGQAFGDNARGKVMYEAGHSHDKSDKPENVAAQRLFFNFSLFASIDKAPAVVINIPSDTLIEAKSYNFTSSVSSPVSSIPYSYQWSTLNCGGTFSNPTSPSTSFTPSAVLDTTTCILRLVVTDACGRFTFMDKIIVILPGEPKIGIAKKVVSGPVDNLNGSFTFTYSIKVKNMGDVSLSSLQVKDNLASTFAGSSSFNVNSVSSSKFTVNPGFNGIGVTDLLSGSNTLVKGDSGFINLTLTVFPGSNYGIYNNTAVGSGTAPSGISASDNSQDGNLVDPDFDGDPTNNNTPTPISFPRIELTKTGILNPNVIAPNGIANVGDKINYSFKVCNTGKVNLTNVLVTDPLITISGGPLANLTVGNCDSTTFTGIYTLTQADINSGKKDNTATVTGKDPFNQNISDTDDETTNIPKIATIDLQKFGTLNTNVVAPNGIANAGDQINYSFTVTNTGNVTLSNISITDPIITVVGGPITLAPGASNSVAFTGVYTLTQADIDAGVKNNTATVHAKDPQNLDVTDWDDETTNIPKNATIDLQKVGSLNMNVVAPNGIANVGDKINYSFTVTNTGNVTLSNITITDPLITVVGGPIALAPGASNSVAFTGVYTLTQADLDAGLKNNTATVHAKDPQNFDITDWDDETTNIPKNATIDLKKFGTLNMNVIAPNGIANVGDQINYTFSVTNTGNVTLTNITITDPLITIVGGPITLAPGASNSVAFTGVYTLTQADIDAGLKNNTATVHAKDPQNLDVTDWDDETTNIPKNAAIDLQKFGTLVTNVVAPNGIANVGDQINYSFTVTNTGNVTLTNITITDPLITIVGGPITLAPGASNSVAFTGVYTLTQADIDTGLKNNTATVHAKDPQNLDVTDWDDETTNIPKIAAVDLQKVGTLNMNVIAPNGIANVGDQINYTFTVTNTGNVTLTNITITDPNITVAGGPITLAPGASNSVAFTGVYTLTQADINAGQKVNTATAHAKDPQNLDVSDWDDETTNIPKIAAVDLQKVGTLNMNVIAPNGIANVGDQINYAFTLTNTGNVTLTNITITDPLITVVGGPITLAPGASNSVAFTGVYTLTQADIDTGLKNNTATVHAKDPQNLDVSDWDDETTNIPKNATIDLQKFGTLNMNVIAPNGIANVGDQINYTFTVTNTGNVTLTNITITDPLITVVGGPITLAPGASNGVAFTGVYTLTQGDIDAGIKNNTATVHAKDPQNLDLTDWDDETTNIPKIAAVDLQKVGTLNTSVVAPNGIANVGDQINYTFTVTNTGNVTLTNITITDPNITVLGGPITLAPEASNSIAFTGVYTLTQADIDAGLKNNTATVHAKDPQNLDVADWDDETTNIPKNAKIDLQKFGTLNTNVVAPNGIANVGDQINYSFTVTNTGNVTLTNITITDPLITVAGGPITLAPGASNSVAFTGVYTLTQADIDAGVKNNTATVHAKDPQNLDVTDWDDETTNIPKNATIDLQKVGSLNMNVVAPNGIANVGDQINYSFTVTNSGNVTLTNITITDPLISVVGGPITLAPGASNGVAFTGVYTLTQADLDAGLKNNTATVHAKDPQNVDVSDWDDETTNIPKNATIDLQKVGSLNTNVVAPNGIANVGDQINYTFTVTNSGNVTLSNIAITDPLITVAGGPITLAPGASNSIAFTGVYTLTQADIDAGLKNNTATVHAKDPQNLDVTDWDDEMTNIPKNATIELQKFGTLNTNVVAPNGIANVGDQINYSFTVTNMGNVTLTNIAITDPLITVAGGPITLAPGASNSVAFTGVYTLTQADIDTGLKNNTATVHAKDPQNLDVTDWDDETTNIPKIAAVDLQKVGTLNMNVIAPNGIANVGDQINYAFTVTNTGNVTLSNITITDPLITVVGGPITLAPGASNSVAFTGVYTLTQGDIDAGIKNNTATVHAKDPHNLDVSDWDDETTNIPKIATIDLQKFGTLNTNVVAPNGIANVGDQINYTFTVTNTGNVTLTNITITDPNITVLGGPITLAPGASNSIAFTGVYTLTQADIDAGLKNNTATVHAKDPQNVDVSDWDDETTNIPKIAAVDLQKFGTLNMNVIAPNGIANVGDQINYTFTVTNTGNVTLTNITITDPLITVVGGPITLAPGASNSVAFTGLYTLTQGDIDAGIKNNTATVHAKDPQNLDVTDWDDETTNIPKNATIDLQKVGSLNTNVVAPNGIANVGDQINYTFTVTNSGNVTLSNIAITDPLITVAGGPITLAPGASNSVAFTGVYTLTQADIDTGLKNNTATVHAKDPQNLDVTDWDDETTNIPKIAAVDLQKVGTLNMNVIDPNGIANVGDQINYAFTVMNAGNVTLTNITITDPLITVVGGPITLAPGASNSVAFTGVYTLTQADIDAGIKNNTATVHAKDPQNLDVTDWDDETTNIPKNATIDLQKVGSLNMNVVAPNGIANVGDQINYTFTVTNTGNVTLSNITITDPLISIVGGPITLAPGASNSLAFTGVYTLTQADIDAGIKNNTATVHAKDPQNVDVSDWDDETTNIPKNATIDLQKFGTLNMNVIAPNGIANVGDQINYTFTVTNTGNVTLSNITITDPLINVVGGPITLAPGASNSVAFTGVYTLTQTDIDAGIKNNTATVHAKDPQNLDVTDWDDETTNIPKIAAVDLQKFGTLNMNVIAPNGIANVGDQINYTFTVTNSGNVTLSNIAITDPLITVVGGPITLAPGASNSVSFTGVYTLTQGDIDSGIKINTATVHAKDPQNLDVTDWDDESTNIPKIAAADLQKFGTLNMNVIAPNGIANVGDQINYTFTVTNTGNVTLTNITITDPNITVVGGPITLAPGASNGVAFTGVYTLTQADIDVGLKNNTATVHAKDPQNVDVTDWDDETTNIPKIATMDLQKFGTLNTNVVAPNGIANVGDQVNYAFTVTNTGNVTLSNITITDPIITVVGGPITLAPGASNGVAYTGVYTLTQADIDAGIKNNTATVHAKDPQNLDVTDWDDETTNIPKYATIDLQKVGSLNTNVVAPNGIANVGDQINYTFTITNTGNVTLTNIAITDPIITVIGGPINLAPGASNGIAFTGTYTLTQADIDAGIKNNTATVNAKDPQNLDVTDWDDETTNIPQVPKIMLEKTGTWNDLNNSGYSDVGETINYKFKVCNTGNVTLTNISITDPLVMVAGGPIPNLNVGICNSVEFTGIYAITQVDIDTGRVINVATVKAIDPKGNLVEDWSDDPTDLTNNDPDNDGDPDDETKTGLPQNPKLGVAKKLVSIVDNNNGTFTSSFELTLKNNGNVTLGDLQLVENLTSEFGIYSNSASLNPGEYAPKNISIVQNSSNQVFLNTGFNGMTDLNLLNVPLGGTVKVGEYIKVRLEVFFRPLKYEYYNQAIGLADKPNHDNPTGFADFDPQDAADFSDSGSNASNDPLTGGTNPGEPGDKGTVDDPTFLQLPVGQLKGIVWDDLNGNGIHDINEPGLQGVEAVLYNCNGVFFRKDTTDQYGQYIFDFLQTPMVYFVLFRTGSYAGQYGFTIQNAGNDDSIDSDVNGSGYGPCISIGLSEKKGHYDAGLVRYASTGDIVWIDKDANGVHDLNEIGLKDVDVVIYNAITKVPVKSAKTNANGYYLIKELLPGDYYLKFDYPVNAIQSTPNATVDYEDSDVDNSNGPGTTTILHLSPGEIDLSWDAGVYNCAYISGDVWKDDDKDGIYDPQEKGINGLYVFIIDAVTGKIVDSVRTDIKPWTPSEDGYYKSHCLKPGSYYVLFERPGNLGASAPYQGNNPDKDSDITHENGINSTRKLVLYSGENITNIGAGFQTKSLVGDKVWVDSNYNGLQDDGEIPLAEVKVSAYNSNGVVVSQSKTTADGKFMLDGMTQGSYYVKFELPNSNYSFTKSHAGSDEIDSDVDGTYGMGSTKMFSIAPGEVIPNIDAGVVSQALALEWLSFSGLYNGEFVELNWTTGAEEENDHFEVERKFENEKYFVQIDHVPAHHNPNLTKHEYQADDFAVKNQGTYYYRLKQVDKDGNYSFSKTISIRVSNERDEMNVSIYPNPVSDLMKIELWLTEDTDLELKVHDSNGRTILASSTSGFKAKGKYYEIINTADLISGQYVLEIKTSNGVMHKRFSVLK